MTKNKGKSVTLRLNKEDLDLLARISDDFRYIKLTTLVRMLAIENAVNKDNAKEKVI